MSETHVSGPLTVGIHEDNRSIGIIGGNAAIAQMLTSGCAVPLPVESAIESAYLLAAAYTSYDRHFGINSVQAAEDDVLGQMAEALQPFANYACELEPGETCGCHNCRARAVLSRLPSKTE